jgi:hypothetical protein
MARRMESGEALRDRSIADMGSDHTVPFIPTSNQFDTRACARCSGLLVNEWCNDFDNTGNYFSIVLRCVQCGHRVDPVILQNQILSPVETKPLRDVRHKYSVKTAALGENA